MHIELLCPSCGACKVEFDSFESAVMLAPNLALMQFRCPRCKINLSVTIKLTAAMQHVLQEHFNICEDSMPAKQPRLSYSSALVVDANTIEYGIARPLRDVAQEIKEELESFHKELESCDNVDAIIGEIDEATSSERRDL